MVVRLIVILLKFVQSYDPMDDVVFNDNHLTFQDLFEKKGSVIDEILEDEEG